jgi:hypothetical protein
VVRAPATVSDPTWLLVILARLARRTAVDLPQDERGSREAMLASFVTTRSIHLLGRHPLRCFAVIEI